MRVKMLQRSTQNTDTKKKTVNTSRFCVK